MKSDNWPKSDFWFTSIPEAQSEVADAAEVVDAVNENFILEMMDNLLFCNSILKVDSQDN